MNSYRQSRRRGGSLAPPQITTSISVGHVFRFQTTAAGSYSISGQSLGDLICMATSATAAYQLTSAVRLSRIEMWGTPSSSFAPVTVSCDFRGTTAGTFGPSRLMSDTSVGSTRVAHLVAQPPRDSQASQWQSASSTGVIGTISYPAGCVIDIHYALTLNDNAGVQSVTGTVAGATVGQLYVRSLDSNNSTAVIQPLSYITI